MMIKNLACAALLASFAVGAAQAQPAAETPGMSRGATVPMRTQAPAVGTQTPTGAVQGTTSPSGAAGQLGAAQGTMAPQGASGQAGAAPQGHANVPQGSVPRHAAHMGAGKPATAMPQGSIAGEAQGMGGTRPATRH